MSCATGRPAVLAGCEYYFSSEMLELVERGSSGPLTGLNRGQYLLVELPPAGPLRTAEAVFHELSILGVTPVVAHPERHPLLRREPAALERLLRFGAVAQLTAGSLLGDFGERAKDSSEELLRRGLVSVVASDAHSLEQRPPRLAAAREHVRRLWGEEVETGLFESNPEAVLASKPMPWAAARQPAGRVGRVVR
jgi:protein-tyrosine phosphatase